MQVRKRTPRFVSVFLLLITCLVFFSVKLLLIQFFRREHLARLAESQHTQYIRLEPIRGTILDRQLRTLAVNVAAYSLYANPRLMKAEDKEKVVTHLSGLLKVDPQFVRDRLSRKKYFVWLARKLPAEQTEKIKALKIHGLGFIKESKRYYPNQYLAAHLIGFAGMDNKGLEGIEMQFDKYLKGEYGWTNILRDARQRELMIEKDFVPPKDGFSLVLTIDETIQYIAEKALDKAYKVNNALGATIVVMDPKTGEILALANRPTYNISDAAKSPSASRTNRAIAFVYEPGSVFKIVAASAAIETGAFKETDKIYCENGQYRVANHILHDHGKHGSLTFQQVIEQSSNIGTTKIAQKLGPDVFYQFGHRFRFGIKTGIDLLGEVDGILKPPSRWSKTSIGAIPIGHEVAVTAMQLLGAISAIANDGVYMKPFVVKYIKDNKDELIKSYEPQIVDRVLSASSAQRVREILAGVVENGTGKRAKVEGMRVGGKTGTAEKPIGGKYVRNKNYASFVGFAPVDNPRLAAVIIFDEPHPNHFGGTVAAPVFSEVMTDALKYLETKS